MTNLSVYNHTLIQSSSLLGNKQNILKLLLKMSLSDVCVVYYLFLGKSDQCSQ